MITTNQTKPIKFDCSITTVSADEKQKRVCFLKRFFKRGLRVTEHGREIMEQLFFDKYIWT